MDEQIFVPRFSHYSKYYSQFRFSQFEAHHCVMKVIEFLILWTSYLDDKKIN
jgi:hypothetical protein